MKPLTEQESADIAAILSAKLWECSTLRHGLFTPPKFRRICETVILEALCPDNYCQADSIPRRNQPTTMETAQKLEKCRKALLAAQKLIAAQACLMACLRVSKRPTEKTFTEVGKKQDVEKLIKDAIGELQ